MIKILSKIKSKFAQRQNQTRIKKYLESGRNAWSVGYLEYRNQEIEETLRNLPVTFNNWGIKLDERVVEIPWAFQNLSTDVKIILDAGSSLNHEFILNQPLLNDKELSICTYYPEPYSRIDKRISYVFADLRNMPFRNNWFDAVICISTIEHIEMDNSMYGYQSEAIDKKKSYSYLIAISDMIRLLKNGGQLLLTFPFGKFENHGFFQQFDTEMVQKIEELLNSKGNFAITYFQYTENGWNESSMEVCKNSESYNPHTGVGKKSDGAAHSRAICCISFIKN